MDFSLWEQRVLAEVEQDFAADRQLAALARMLDPRRRSVRRRVLRLRGARLTRRRQRGRALFVAVVLLSVLAGVGGLVAALVTGASTVATVTAAGTVMVAVVLIIWGSVRRHRGDVGL
jgi:DNA-binding Lrp family transcriptional regulator